MNDDVMRKVIEQAKELQQKVTDAMTKGQEQAQPYMEQAMKQADVLRQTLLTHARDSADSTHEQTNQALDQLDAALKSGAEALKAQASAAKPLFDTFLRNAREAVDHVSKTFEK
ncbi:MAG: hypothetical protein ACYDGM_10805 [Vulcanimicrobiaceae bacterium]